MLETTLQQLRVILQRNLKNVDLAEKILLYMDRYYTVGSWIYPGTLKRKFRIDIKVVYMILLEMQNIGYLSPYYEVICDKCNHTIGEAYPSLDSIPEFIECENCEGSEPIIAVKNAYLIFKVVEDGRQG